MQAPNFNFTLNTFWFFPLKAVAVLLDREKWVWNSRRDFIFYLGTRWWWTCGLHSWREDDWRAGDCWAFGQGHETKEPRQQRAQDLPCLCMFSSIHLAFFQSVFLFTFWGGTIPKTDPGGRLCLEVPGLATKGKKTERQKGYTAKWDNNRRAIYLQFKKKKGTFWSLLKQGKTACHTGLILCIAWTSAGPNHSSLPFSPRTRPDSQASCLLTGAGTVPLPPVGLFPQVHREPGASCPLGIRNTASGSYSSAFNCNSWGAPWGAAFLLGFEQRGLHCCFCHRPNAISPHL